MPNTKSAERRTRSNARKQTANHMVNSRLKTLEKTYAELLGQGKKEDAATALRQVSAALDKAAKTGVLHRSAANRKKSRLSLQLNRAK